MELSKQYLNAINNMSNYKSPNGGISRQARRGLTQQRFNTKSQQEETIRLNSYLMSRETPLQRRTKTYTSLKKAFRKRKEFMKMQNVVFNGKIAFISYISIPYLYLHLSYIKDNLIPYRYKR